MIPKYSPLPILAAAILLYAGSTLAGDPGVVERIRVHGASLEGNLEGDSPDRDVSIFLPPSYKSAATRRYPVVYMLHGFTDSDEKWFTLKSHWINLPGVLNQALADSRAREFIV